jgi:hypothetical protein
MEIERWNCKIGRCIRPCTLSSGLPSMERPLRNRYSVSAWKRFSHRSRSGPGCTLLALSNKASHKHAQLSTRSVWTAEFFLIRIVYGDIRFFIRVYQSSYFVFDEITHVSSIAWRLPYTLRVGNRTI